MNILRAIIVLLFICTTSEADIYKYVSEDGVVLYTDTPLGTKHQKIIKEKNNNEELTAAKADSASPAKKRKSNYHQIVNKKAEEQEIDPSLVHAVIKAESNGNPYAVSKKGAMGLMQLMPTTASGLSVKNPFDPEENIDGGTRYLRYLIERFNGNLTLALAAYNAGPTTVEKYGSVPPISETKHYVKKVLKLYNGKSDEISSDSHKTKTSEPIFKIEMEDGTILFTNFPLHKKNFIRF